LPEYPFSNYAGDGTTDPPKHFFDPQMEVSAEELRVKYYLARLQGQEQQAVGRNCASKFLPLLKLRTAS
jgi:hypothetical protein